MHSDIQLQADGKYIGQAWLSSSALKIPFRPMAQKQKNMRILFVAFPAFIKMNKMNLSSYFTLALTTHIRNPMFLLPTSQLTPI